MVYDLSAGNPGAVLLPMQATLFDLSPYPVMAKAKKQASVAQFADICQEHGGLLSITLAGVLVERTKQQISKLIQSGRVIYVEIEQRKFVSVNSLLEWKKGIDERRKDATNTIAIKR